MKNILIGFVLIVMLGVSSNALGLGDLLSESNEPQSGFNSVYTEDSPPLRNVANYKAVKKKYGLILTAGQEKFLDQNRFLLVELSKTSFKPGINFDQMLEDFDSMNGGLIYERKPEDTKLITPDIVLHAYHKYFELTLEQLEQKELTKTLSDFLVSLHGNLATAASKNTGSLKERYQNLEAQIVLARILLDNKNGPKPDYFENPDKETAYNEQDKIVDSAKNAKKILAKYSSDLTPDLIGKIQYDLDKIYAATEIGVSPLFVQYNDDLKTDYTQFTPRSHYNKNSNLRSYFRTMIYLGRSAYFLKKDIGIVDSNLLAKQFTVKSSNGVVPLDAWKRIMAVTSFYAGQSDDLTYNEWQDFQSRTLGNTNSDSDFSSSDNVQKMAKGLDQLRMPKIFSDVIISENIGAQTKADLLRQSLAFRIFGQRFTFDAWVLNSLTAGQEKSAVKLPSTPSALFVSAAFGDLKAQEYSKQLLQKEAGFSNDDLNGFITRLDKKRSDINKVKNDEWFGSMGSAWLYALGSLTHTFGENYPKYMQSVPFQDKQIQTFLGSYAELKHDTLLYAKQSFAEMGGGEDELPIPPVVKGFVEPNIEFWTRFNQLLDHTEQVFTKNDLFKDHAALARLQDFKEISYFFADIAKKELQGQPINDDDYEKLRTTTLAFMAYPFSADDPNENSGKVALIADIHTDVVKNQILYEATGKPYLMLAVVGNERTPRVVAGLVYNHYEFTNPLGKRLTDEDWRVWVYKQTSKLPAKNFWYQSLQVK